MDLVMKFRYAYAKARDSRKELAFARVKPHIYERILMDLHTQFVNTETYYRQWFIHPAPEWQIEDIEFFVKGQAGVVQFERLKVSGYV